MTNIAAVTLVIVLIIFAGVYFAACAFLGWLADAEKREQQIFEDELDG